jgi:hypothetical protein
MSALRNLPSMCDVITLSADPMDVVQGGEINNVVVIQSCSY